MNAVCGIAGVAKADGGLQEDLIIAMAARQRHRGPDGFGVALDETARVGLAMNLLAIVDRTVPPGPYEDPETGTLIAYNGEIYNYRELAELWGIPLLPGESDAHLLLRAYLRLGPSCLDAVDGMFSVAIYDPGKEQLFLARDRFGEKPLYYLRDGARLAFASEIKAIKALVPLSPVFVPEWLSVESPLGSSTPYENVHLLEAGHYLTLDLHTWQITKVCWWSIEDRRRPMAEEPSVVQQEFARILYQAVERRHTAGDFALMLSGGLDSAVLAFLLRPPVLLTVRYPGQPRYDEYHLAQLVADKIGSELICLEPNEKDFRQQAEKIVEDLDYPMGNASLFSERLLYQQAAELGVRVVHGGIGPDELLLGYARHSLALDGPQALARTELSSYQPLQEKFRRAAHRQASAADRYYRLILRGPDATSSTRRLVYQHFARARDLGQAVSLVDMETSFPSLLLSSDKLASSFGIERRSPYLAHEWAEFCFWLPLELKRQGSDTKMLLRDLAREIGVPRDIWGQVDKRGFGSPVPEWLGTSLADWCETHVRRLLKPGAPPLAQLIGLQAARASSPYDRSRLHALLISLWWQRHDRIPAERLAS